MKKRSSKPTLSPWKGFAVLLMPLAVAWASAPAHPQDPTPLKYHHPGLAVDLGVGLWALPLPMDFDGDGDYDLVVACPDKPYNGTYFFENVTGNVPMPIFRPGVRIGPGHHSARVSRVGSEYRVLIPGRQFRDFSRQRFEAPEDFSVPRNIHTEGHKIRANQWQLVDFDGDFHRIDRAAIAPRPEVTVPIWFGGFADVALRRAARLGDGFTFTSSGSDTVETLDKLRGHISDAGRDSSTYPVEFAVAYSSGPNRWERALQRAVDNGVTHMSVNTMIAGAEFYGTTPSELRTIDDHIGALEEFITAVE